MMRAVMSNSIFDEIGGSAAIEKAVSIFYAKVSQDSRINRFFEGVELPAQERKMVKFLTMAVGGPSAYEGKSMRAAHAHLVQEHGLNDSHFDAVVEHLGATLTELSVPAPHIQAIATKVEGLRDDVLNR